MRRKTSTSITPSSSFPPTRVLAHLSLSLLLPKRFIIEDTLGSGTFGQVVRCAVHEPVGGAGPSTSTPTPLPSTVAVKVVKSQAAFYQQARVEVGVLRLLNAHSPGTLGDRHIVRLLDAFPHEGHLCLVFELLSLNLYELVKRNRFRGLSLSLLRVLVSQVLAALAVLGDHGVVHCDVKPENILLKSLDAGDVKLIDYGSACFEARRPGAGGGGSGGAAYIQSRFYRAPEVLLGAPYGPPIDVWSLGCVAAELFLGLPLFPGASEYDQMARIVAGLGGPPPHLIEAGVAGRKFFKRAEGGAGGSGEGMAADGGSASAPSYTLQSAAEYEAAGGRPATTTSAVAGGVGDDVGVGGGSLGGRQGGQTRAQGGRAGGLWGRRGKRVVDERGAGRARKMRRGCGLRARACGGSLWPRTHPPRILPGTRVWPDRPACSGRLRTHRHAVGSRKKGEGARRSLFVSEPASWGRTPKHTLVFSDECPSTLPPLS